MGEFVLSLVLQALERVWITFAHNWYYLVLAALVAAALKVYLNQDRIAGWLQRRRGASVVAAVGAAVGTPLCSCGTTAIVLGMMATTMPWAPVVAFLVASPLTSPGELFYSASLFGWPFAIAFFAASIILGLAGGLAAHMAESRGWLKDQARFKPVAGGSDAGAAAGEMELAVIQPVQPAPGLRDLTRETVGALRTLLPRFLIFAFVGYLLNGLLPASWLGALFGEGRIYGVPLAATLGLPFYINTEASLPLVASFMEAGMSPGATLAFLISGAGTSIGAITGALTIARWRVVGIVAGTLWVGAVVLGYLYNAALVLL